MKKRISIFSLGLFLMISTFSVGAQEKIWVDCRERPVQQNEACAYLIVGKKDTFVQVSRFTLDGRKTAETSYSRFGAQKRERMKEGRHTVYYSNGKDSLVEYYHQGRLQGMQTVFYPDGSVFRKCPYQKGRLDGDVIQYHPNGRVFRKELYIGDGGECEVAEYFDEKGTEIFGITPYYVPAKIRAQEPFSELCLRLLKYPEEAAKKKIEGQVRVGITVDENGRVTKIRLLNKVHPLLDAEALRVAHLLADNYEWDAMRMDNKSQRVSFALPITFKL